MQGDARVRTVRTVTVRGKTLSRSASSDAATGFELAERVTRMRRAAATRHDAVATRGPLSWEF